MGTTRFSNTTNPAKSGSFVKMHGMPNYGGNSLLMQGVFTDNDRWVSTWSGHTGLSWTASERPKRVKYQNTKYRSFGIVTEPILISVNLVRFGHPLARAAVGASLIYLRFGSTCSPKQKPSAKCSFTIALQKKPSGQMPSGQMLSILCPNALCQMLSSQMPSKQWRAIVQRAIGGGHLSGGHLSGGHLSRGQLVEGICPESKWQRGCFSKKIRDSQLMLA